MKKILDIRVLHAVSALAVLGVILIASLANIEQNKVFLELPLGYEIEIGKCYYRDHFDVECPSCGLTRSFISIENFKLSDAISYNRIGIFIYFLFVLLLIFNIMGMLKAKRTILFGKIVAVYGIIVCILLMISWLIKIFMNI